MFSICKTKMQQLSLQPKRKICLMLTVYALFDLVSKRRSSFIFELYNIFFSEKSLFHFFVIAFYYTFLQEELHRKVTVILKSSCFENTQKNLTVGGSFYKHSDCETPLYH